MCFFSTFDDYYDADPEPVIDDPANEAWLSAEDAELYVFDPDAPLVNALTETIFLADYADAFPLFPLAA